MATKVVPLAMVHLEGTTLEGGGQLLRVAVGLSSLTKKPVNIANIRGKRSGGGGLKTQHLTSVQWLGQACSARLSGVGLKSKELTFMPQLTNNGRTYKLDEQGGEVRINQSTPGSINLVLQAILPYILFSGASSPIRLRITGGTNVSNSPSYDYILEVLIPMLSLVGLPPMEAKLHSRGWSLGSTYLGTTTYTIAPLTTKLPAFQLTDRGAIIHVKAVVIAPRDSEQHFRDELAFMFDKRESRIFGADGSSASTTEITFEDSHHDKRYYLLLVATSASGIKLGRDWLYDQGVRPGKTEKIVPTMTKKVSDDLLSEIEHGGCVDEYMRDQLVVFQSLAEGTSNVFGGQKGDALVQPSLHAKTAMWVAKQITGVQFSDEGGCEGIGFHPGGKEAEEGILDALETDLEDKLYVSAV
jgi:RNA 3'-terminal phosphate cyclase (ATP)